MWFWEKHEVWLEAERMCNCKWCDQERIQQRQFSKRGWRALTCNRHPIKTNSRSRYPSIHPIPSWSRDGCLSRFHISTQDWTIFYLHAYWKLSHYVWFRNFLRIAPPLLCFGCVCGFLTAGYFPLIQTSYNLPIVLNHLLHHVDARSKCLWIIFQVTYHYKPNP